MKIPVSVIVVVQNEEKKIGACLAALTQFSQVIVVDSASRDKTLEVAKAAGAETVAFSWNGKYPKKRQWCLDHLPLHHDWALFVDADEIIPDALAEEIRRLFMQTPAKAGYFIKGWHRVNGKILRHGWQNNKLVLFDRRKIEFPVVDDLDIPGMGEIEGHYQPVLKYEFKDDAIGQLRNGMIHDALDDDHAWAFRHKKYARWETGMNRKEAWPVDPKPSRAALKNFLRRSKFRAEIVFFAGFFLLLGFLDGKEGLKFALKKHQYYKLISQ